MQYYCIKIKKHKYISAWLTFQSGQTPLMFAAASGLSEFVSLLLAHGADVSAEDEDRCTALHLAARNGHLGVARALIEAGAAKEAQDVGLWTPLVWAAYKVCLHSDQGKEIKCFCV